MAKVLVPPELVVGSGALWRLAWAEARAFGSPLSTRCGPLSIVWCLPATVGRWLVLRRRRGFIAVHDRAHLIVEQVHPPADPTDSTTDSFPFLVFVAVVLGGVLLAAALSNTTLLVVWLLVVLVAVTAVVVEARLTRDATSTSRLCGAADTVIALGHQGVIVRVDNFTSTRPGDGRELMARWRCYVDGHDMAIVLNARTLDLARHYATYDGFHSVSPDDQLVMYRRPARHGTVD